MKPPERSAEQAAQDIRDRAKLRRDGISVAKPLGTTRFHGALCVCGRVIHTDQGSWVHFESGTVECPS